MHSESESKAPKHSPLLPTIESTGGQTIFMTSLDGVSLRCAYWPPVRPPALGCALILQGRTEFIEKNLETVGELRRRGFSVWTLDWRGQGLSGRLLQDPHRGHVADYRDYLQDLQLLVFSHIKGQMAGPLVLFGHSMGGHIGLRFLHDHPELFERAVLCAPMIGIRSGFLGCCAKVLVTIAGGLGVIQAYVPGIGPYDVRNRRFEGNALTSDSTRFAREHAYIAADPRLALGGPTLGWLAASFRSIAHVRREAREIRTPVLIIAAGDERVVDNKAMHHLIKDLANGRLVAIPDARHDLLRERDDIRQQLWRHFDDFVACSAGS